MSSNASIEATEATSKPMTQPLAVQAKTAATSPMKSTPSVSVKGPEKIVARRAIKATDKKMAVAPSQPTAGKAVAPSQKTSKPKATKAVPQRPQKIKMVRDSFTFPETEHKRLVEMKKRLIALGTEVKKGELVRAGLELLAALDNQKLLRAVVSVEKLKTGRPKK